MKKARKRSNKSINEVNDIKTNNLNKLKFIYCQNKITESIDVCNTF